MNAERNLRVPERRESPSMDLFVVIKPDGGRYLKELEETLKKN